MDDKKLAKASLDLMQIGCLLMILPPLLILILTIIAFVWAMIVTTLQQIF